MVRRETGKPLTRNLLNAFGEKGNWKTIDKKLTLCYGETGNWKIGKKTCVMLLVRRETGKETCIMLLVKRETGKPLTRNLLYILVRRGTGNSSLLRGN
jgi:hypothetical protein